jgi:hypothetical protein
VRDAYALHGLPLPGMFAAPIVPSEIGDDDAFAPA